MANIINRPIIDADVTAFPCSFKQNKDVLRVYFYFQSTDKEINEDYIFAAVTKGGQYQYLLGTAYEPFKVWRDSENLVYPDRRYIEIPSSLVKVPLVDEQHTGTFPLNTAFNVSLMTISNNYKDEDANFFNILQNRIWHRDAFKEYQEWVSQTIKEPDPELHSAWSRTISFLPIARPTLMTWGGLTEAQVATSQSLTEDEAVVHLLDSSKLNEQEFDPGDKYIFKCELSFDTHNNVDLQENDQLQSYEVQLFGISNQNDTVEIYSNTNSQLATGYATRVQLETTNGQAFLDTKWDKTKRLFRHTLNYNFLEGGFNTYELAITYYTTKNYKETITYVFKAQEVKEEKEIFHDNLTLQGLTCTPINDRGVINITAEIKDGRNNPIPELGILVIERAEDINAGADTQHRLKWYSCYEASFHTSLESITAINIDDASAEPGVFYKYRIRFKIWSNAQKQYLYATGQEVQDKNTSYLEIEEPIILFVEDIFLATRDLTLKIRYNPELSSYKRNVVDAITPTLGGAYPFMRRNGAQKYRTFTLGGLISYNAELYEPKIDDLERDSVGKNADSIGQGWISTAGDDKFYQSLFIKSNSAAWQTLARYDQMASDGKIDKEQKRVLYERLFRNMVMDFLYDDQVLLFKSLPEGNIFIRLSNVQLTPNKTLDRHIYSFTATATEVLEANSENYLKYFSPPATGVESTVQNIYLIAGYYQYEDGVLYVGGGTDTSVTTDGQGYLVSSTWNRDGVQDGYTTIDLHLETRKTETEWEG